MAGHTPRKTFQLLLSVVLLFGQLPGGTVTTSIQPGKTAPEKGAGLKSSVQTDSPNPDTAVLPAGAGADWWTAAQAGIRQAEYQVTWQEKTYLPDVPSAYQAPNRAQNLRTYFTPEGVRLIPRQFEGQTAPWEWNLSLTGYGYSEMVRPVSESILSVKGNRIEYRRNNLTEWYVNDEQGLEQGFTLQQPPISTAAAAGSSLANNVIALELAVTGNLIASLCKDAKGVDFTTASGAVALRYDQLKVTDATGRNLPARMELLLSGSHDSSALQLVFDASEAAYPIIVDPLATSPAWTAESDQAAALFGQSVATAGDVNGDGYSDVIVGAPNFDNGQAEEGRAFVYHGSPTGLSVTANWTAESDQPSAFFGQSVATAGDVNGDGYSDVIVGAPGYGAFGLLEEEGRAFLYHGSASGLSPVANWTAKGDQEYASYGRSVATAGDVNGDGFSDVIIGAPGYSNGQGQEGRAFLYTGSTSGLSSIAAWTAESNQANAFFGFSVSTAGDINGDGFSDVIIGAPYYDNGETDEGRVFVYHGSSSGLAASAGWTAEGNQMNANFGQSVATAGDVNGDGYSDVVVGAPKYGFEPLGGREGGAFVYHGSSSGLSATANWTAKSNLYADFGCSVATAGDINGDGYSDVIVGEWQYANGQLGEGRALIYQGSAAGLSTKANWTAESNQASAYFGISVSTAGDVNGDGYSDVIVGAPGYDNGQTDEGRAFVYYGSAAGPATIAGWTDESNQISAQFGFSVASAGDVNGDGYGDVIVGAPFYDNGQTDEGRAFVYHGSATGLSPIANWTAESDQPNAGFGFSAATAGDVNGDGFSDVIIGALGYDNGQQDEGRAFVFHGSTAGLSTTANWTAESNQASSSFGTSVATAGDVNGDGYSDVIIGAPYYDNGHQDEGRAFVFHGSSTGLSATPNWTAESNQASSNFGRSVATAGDVNGDGFSDVIVGAPSYANGQLNEGRAFVYHGSLGGLPATANWEAENNGDYSNFGWSVSTAGDVNGDGYSDVIVGAPGYYYFNLNVGRAYVFHGSATGLSTAASWTAGSNQLSAYFGISVSTAGDVNGDGYSDIVVGVPGYRNGQTNEGRVYVYHGSVTGLSTTENWTVESDLEGAQLGNSVATAGDVNGDGYSDVIAGARLYNDGKGRAFLYYGNGGSGLSMLPRQMRTDGSQPIALLGRSDSRTSFQLRLTGRMPLGRDDAKLQWQVAPLGISFTSPSVIGGTTGWTDLLPGGTILSQNITGLTEATPYHWRVRLLYRPGNALGLPASRWIHSAVNGWNEQDFRTNAPPPAAFSKSSPVNSAAAVSASPILSWGSSSGASSYEYCYDTTNNGNCDGSWTSTGTGTSATISGLSYGTVYYWQVRARNSGSDTYADSGAWWSFTTQIAPPGAFNKSAPMHGDRDVSTSPTLSWNPASGATSYEYCYDTLSREEAVSEDGCYGTWTSTGTSISAGISGLFFSTTYYWQVRARNAGGTRVADGGSWWSFTTEDEPPPVDFSKSAPTNAASGVSTSPTLSWTTSSGAAGYEYCYDTTNDNDCSGSWTSAGTSTTAALSGLGTSTTYYWQVRATNAGGTTYANIGAWWSFTTVPPPPSAFGKSMPMDGAAAVSTAATLSWNSSTGAAGYEYCYDTSNDSACSGSWTSTGTNTTAALSGLTYNTAYYWQVRATNAGGTTYANSGTWWSFTTQIAPPGAFNKSVPANAATGVSTNPILSWAASSGAASYEYCYDTSNNSSCDGSWTSIGTSTSAGLSGLAYDTAYYWQVRATNAGGTTYANIGTWWSFTTQVEAPGNFNKNSPTSGSTGVSTSPTLLWAGSSRATSYEYCYDTSNDNSCDGSWTSTGSSTSASISGLAYSTAYYWQVRARNAGGTIEATGGWWSFTTQVEAPGNFNKNSPTSGSTGVSTSPTLSWAGSPRATSYEYCYDTSNDSACSGSWTSTGSNTSAGISGLSTSTTYYWQVRAQNAGGTTEATSGWWSFTTQVAASEDFYKTSPVNSATAVSISPMLIWGTSSGATSYEYCYDTSNDSACSGSWTSTGTGTSASLSGLAYNTAYYWQVRATNSGGTTYANNGTWWSFTTQVEAPGSFNKTSPTSGSTSVSTSPTLLWAGSPRATSYEYCYDTSNDNSCDGSWTSTGSSTSASISGLAYSTAYYWQVRARNAGGTIEATGGWWSFTTQVEAPGNFNKNSPTSGSTDVSTSPTLSWAGSLRAASYEYCYDTSNDNSCSGSWTSTGSSTSAVLSGLGYSTIYYWQVRARNAAGTTEATGGWWSFTTQIAPPVAFTKLSPNSNQQGLPYTLGLFWADSSGATSYEYCFDTINNNACDGTWSSTLWPGAGLSGLSKETTYYWQVRAINAGGTTYADGINTWWSFKTRKTTSIYLPMAIIN